MEYKALQIIMSAGSKGVPQCELWRELGATSREGSRIALRLLRKGLIRREKELYNGRWTYRLYPKWKHASIDPILGCPCLLCPDDPRCGPWGSTSPNECERLTRWILELAEKYEIEKSEE